MKYPKYHSLIIHLKQILHSQKTKAKIETGITIEYDVTSYQVKNNIVKSTNTKTGTSFSFLELHANKIINQSLHVVDLKIDCYDMIIDIDLISFLALTSMALTLTFNGTMPQSLCTI